MRSCWGGRGIILGFVGCRGFEGGELRVKSGLGRLVV
jgi:hypothetical protein